MRQAARRCNLFKVDARFDCRPRVARASQPWAECSLSLRDDAARPEIAPCLRVIAQKTQRDYAGGRDVCRRASQSATQSLMEGPPAKLNRQNGLYSPALHPLLDP